MNIICVITSLLGMNFNKILSYKNGIPKNGIPSWDILKSL